MTGGEIAAKLGTRAPTTLEAISLFLSFCYSPLARGYATRGNAANDNAASRSPARVAPVTASPLRSPTLEVSR